MTAALGVWWGILGPLLEGKRKLVRVHDALGMGKCRSGYSQSMEWGTQESQGTVEITSFSILAGSS